MRIYFTLALVFVIVGLLPWIAYTGIFQAAFSGAVYMTLFLIYTGGRFFVWAVAALPAVYILRRWTR